MSGASAFPSAERLPADRLDESFIGPVMQRKRPIVARFSGIILSTMRLLNLLKSKIHRATVTQADLNYVGSITIDRDLMDRTGLVAGELVHVWDADNGERLETYVIEGARGDGQIIMNGPAAYRIQVGHRVIIAAFCLTDELLEPRVILVDEANRFVRDL